MDAYEARLQEEIRQRRADLVKRAEALRRSVVDSLDPREPVRRHPFGSILASLSAGMLLGGAFPRRGRRGSGAAPGDSVAADMASAMGAPGLVSMAAGLLPSLLPMIVPLLGRLMSRDEPATDAEASNGSSGGSVPS